MTTNLKTKPPTRLSGDGFSLLSISGSDAQHFLNNQLTIDAPVEIGVFNSGAWCNAKGRVIVSLEIARTSDDGYSFIIPSDLVESLTKKLTLFILRAQVRVAEIATTFSLIRKSEFSNDSIKNNAVLGEWLEGTLEGYCAIDEGHGEHGNKDEHSQDFALLHDYLIARGYPLITKTQSEQWIAQQLNMDRLNMIDFEKGCYPGQEVIARIYYKGAVKKRLSVIPSASDFNEDTPNAEDRINTTIHPIDGWYYAEIVSKV